MALQAGDLFVVNRAGTSYKLDYTAIQTALQYTLPAATGTTLGGIKVGAHLAIDANGVLSANLPGALIYKGTVAANATPPTGPASGDVWLLSSAGTLTGAGWGTLAGKSVTTGDMLIYAGSSWDHIGNSGGGGGGGMTGVDVTAPITKGGTAARPLIGVADATTAVKGVVQLWDGAAGTATSTTLAVTAAQLDAAKAVYASAADTKTGSATNKSVTPAAGKATYMPLDLSTLAALP
jgi:hypothetical protein